jgi:hypothetical protein
MRCYNFIQNETLTYEFSEGFDGEKNTIFTIEQKKLKT